MASGNRAIDRIPPPCTEKRKARANRLISLEKTPSPWPSAEPKGN
jgi:hypothetical protein